MTMRRSGAEPKARFTALFERLAIDVLRETSVTGATKILRISWDEAHHIIERAVERGLARKGELGGSRLGVDEKSAAKGHRYMTLVTNLETGTVEYVGHERTTESLNAYFVKLTTEQRAAIEAIAMDMWVPYQSSVSRYVPNAGNKIVFDRFHIMQHMTKAVDAVRRRESKELASFGDETLSGTKYLWLYSDENLPEKHRERFERLRKADLRTARAWAIKENLRELWRCEDMEAAKDHWDRWHSWAIRSQLKPIIAVAKMIDRHIDNVLTYFKHRITNAVSEGINSKIQTIKKQAYGYRNRENFKMAIYFHCGGLELYPASETVSASH
jgi:transposase